MFIVKKEYKWIIIKMLVDMKKNGDKIVMFMVYDYIMVKIVDSVGIDVILVGDLVFNVMVGYEIILFIILD